MPDLSLDRMLEVATVEESLFIWMAVHGNLYLALRHPDNRGASREYVASFAARLGQLLVEKGVLTAAELAAAVLLEQHEQAREQTRQRG